MVATAIVSILATVIVALLPAAAISRERFCRPSRWPYPLTTPRSP